MMMCDRAKGRFTTAAWKVRSPAQNSWYRSAIASAAYDQKAIACTSIYYGWLRNAIACSKLLAQKCDRSCFTKRSKEGR